MLKQTQQQQEHIKHNIDFLYSCLLENLKIIKEENEKLFEHIVLNFLNISQIFLEINLFLEK